MSDHHQASKAMFEMGSSESRFRDTHASVLTVAIDSKRFLTSEQRGARWTLPRKKSNAKEKLVLSNLQFDMKQGEFVTLLGPSGCGKTTLLRIVAGLDTDFDGSVKLNDRPVGRPGPDRSLLFQESRLLPWFTVAGNLNLAVSPNSFDGVLPRSRMQNLFSTITMRKKRREKVTTALKMVGLSHEAETWPKELSGGMTKRVALARALVNIPVLLLLDEPLTGLDMPLRYSLQDDLLRIHSEERTMTTLLVTHDIDEAVYLSDRVLVMSPAPSRIVTEVDIPMPRPRDRNSVEFRGVYTNIFNAVLELWRNQDSL